MPFVQGHIGYKGQLGKTFTAEHRLRISLAKRGTLLSELHRRNVGLALRGYKHSSVARLHMSLARRGENNHRWKGGTTPELARLRHTTEYYQWRENIFARDDYRCLDCGERGGRLNADHIYAFARFPRLRFDINNGRTLREDCHRKTPTFGYRARYVFR